jgi:ABC-type bacteriocin/lantibiotic exporters, contain an N-terminal double-glycine peptidase domain
MLGFFRKISAFVPIKTVVIVQLVIIIPSFFELVGIGSVIPFMSLLFDPVAGAKLSFLKSFAAFFGIANQRSLLWALGATVFIVMAVGNLTSFLSMRILAFTGQKIGYSIANKLYRRYMSREYLFFTKVNTADLATDILIESDRINFGILQPLLLVNSRIVLVLVISGFLIYINPMVSLLAAGSVGLAYGLIFILIKKLLKKNSSEISAAQRTRVLNLNEGFCGFKDVKLAGRESYYVSRFTEACDHLAHLQASNIVLSQFPRYFIEIFVYGFIVFVAIYWSGTMPAKVFLPVLTSFGVAAMKLIPACQIIFGGIATMRASTTALRALDHASESASDEDFAEVEPFHLKSDVRLEVKGFAYPGFKHEVLHDVVLCFPRNSTIGIVGRSGSGKSTLLDMLIGMISSQHTHLVVDGQEVGGRRTRQWQKVIGYVPQEVFMSDKSFAENIAFGIRAEEIDLVRVREAAQMAKIDAFIESLPEGYLAPVGERGQQISGGQRQRVGIARALYRDPDLLVFDEATSALDPVTEQEIISEIAALAGKKTIVIVTHRFSAVRNCDKIVLLQHGRIAAQGRYEEILAVNSLFREMACEAS